MCKDTMETFINSHEEIWFSVKQRKRLFSLEREENDMGLIKVNQKQQQISIICQQRPRV